MRHSGFDEAMAAAVADAEVFERVIVRVQRGVPAHMEMHADEVMPFIRAAVRYRDMAGRLAQHITEIGSASMALGDRDTA